MSVIFNGEVGYSNLTKSAFIIAGTGPQSDGKAFSAPKIKEESQARPWADWGNSNDLPNQMAKDIEEVGVLSAGLEAKARIAIGKGLAPFLLLNVDKEGKEDIEWVSDTEIHDWLEFNDSFSTSTLAVYDRCAYGWNPMQLMLSKNRKKINRIKRTDVALARLEKKDRYGFINNLYISYNWEDNPSESSDFVKKVAVLEEGNELSELLESNSGYEFALINRQMRNGRGYYPPPIWYSAKKWVDHIKAIPALKNAMMKNQITVKYLVTISISYWKRIHTKWDTYTPEKRQDVITAKMQEIDKYLSGIENQFKSLYTMSYVDPITKVEIPDIKIEVLDDKMKDGKLLPDSAAGNSEVLFALCVNPALVGAGQPGGAYANNAGGSNIRESYLTMMMHMEWERRDNARIYNVVKQFNGWSDRLEIERAMVSMSTAGSSTIHTQKKIKPRLVFRYPSGMLTTLDTGKSTKGEVL